MSKLIVKSNENIEAKDHAIYFDYMFGQNGVMNKGNKLDLLIQSANQVDLKDGVVVIQGRPVLIYPNEVINVTVESGTQGMKRNDLVIVEFRKEGSTETYALKTIKGTPDASNPVDPTLTQQDTLSSGTVFQLPLYRIRLNGINIESTDDLRVFIPSINDTVKALSFDNGFLTVEIPDEITYASSKEAELSIEQRPVKDNEHTINLLKKEGER